VVSAVSFAALNAELVMDLDGEASVTIDLRATGITGSPVVVMEGTLDGITYEPVLAYRRDTQLMVFNLAVTTGSSMLIADVAGYRRVRTRVATIPTAGSYSVTLRGTIATNKMLTLRHPATVLGTIQGAVGVASTLTLASPGTGLYHNITRLAITRFATVLLTAAATPVVVTTTNMPGSLAFTIPADAAAVGTVWEKEIDFSAPVKSLAAATATTFVGPATAGVIWRLTAYGYLAG
jgi:hypothetical protein